jgi:tetratricopeptide (TPR) repeat protein
MKLITATTILWCTLTICTTSCLQSPQGYLAKGNQFFAAGKNEEAILNYRKAIQKDARFGEAYYRLGLAELKTGNGRGGYPALVSANRLLPDRLDVKASLADLLLLSYARDGTRPVGFYTQLKKLAEEFLAKDKHSYDGLRIKAYLAWSDGHFKEAEDFFSQANAAKPMTPELVVPWVQALLRDGQDTQAEQVAHQLMQTHKDTAAIYDILYGHYRSQNRLADAENVLRSKANNNPQEIDYALQLATFYASDGKRDQMTAVLKPLLSDTKTHPTAYLQVGDFYLALHDWPEAVRQYEEGSKADPKQKSVYLKRIVDTWLLQGRGDQAASVMGEILKEQPKDDTAKVVNAALLLQSGKLDKIQTAVTELQELVKRQPENVVLRFTLARALVAKGDLDGARVTFQEVLKKRPRHLPSILALAEFSLAKKDYAQTLQYANSALSMNPRLERARFLRATALSGQLNYGEARAEFNSLAKDAPQDLEVQFQLAAIDLAEKKLPQAETRLLQLHDKHIPMALPALVDVYHAEGRMDKATSLLTLEQGKSPNKAVIHSMLADALLLDSKYDAALDQYKQIQILGVRSADLYFRMGRVYMLKSDFKNAVASFQSASDAAPKDPTAAIALGDAFRATGRNAEAAANYRRALALGPENANVLNNLAYTLLDTGTLDEAQKLAERALQESPKNPDYADTLGMVYLKKNLQDSAVQVFTGLTQRFPDNPVFLYHYAISLSQKGQQSKAKMELELALHKSPPDDLRKSIQASLAAIQH